MENHKIAMSMGELVQYPSKYQDNRQSTVANAETFQAFSGISSDMNFISLLAIHFDNKIDKHRNSPRMKVQYGIRDMEVGISIRYLDWLY